MFDKILGKKELEEHIRSLEAQNREQESEIRSITAQLAAREETARKAVSQKQTVDEELNIAQKKIKTLEHEISVLRREAASEPAFRNIGSISRPALDGYIFKMGSVRTLNITLITIYLRAGESLSGLENAGRLFESLGPETASLIDKIESPTGIAVFYDTDQTIREAVVLFLPVGASSWQMETRFNTDPVHELMKQEPGILVMLVRAGESFIGITDGPDAFSDKQIVRSHVKAKHTKGGWSQRRFERLRDEDIRHHVEKVKNELKCMVDGSDKKIDLVVAAGEPRMLSEILKSLDYPVIEKSIDVSVDKRNVDKILKEVWSSRRYEI